MHTPRTTGILSALHGAAAVAAGAFAAHALSDARAIDLLETGARWQSVAALAGLLATILRASVAGWLFAFGGAAFAGSLYALAAGAPSLLGLVTPIGGMSLILGWLALASAYVRKTSTEKGAHDQP